MDNYVAGELSFLTATDAKKNAYSVIKCTIEDSLSSCYLMNVIISNISLTPEGTLGENLTLNWYQNIAGTPNNLLTYHGVITDIHELECTEETESTYALTLRPWFWLLGFNKTNRIFENKTAKDILTAIFDEAGFKGKYKFAGMPSTTSEYRTQLNETDLAFCQRIMSEDGIIYYFEQTDSDHILHLQDVTIALKKNAQAKFEHQQTKSGNQLTLETWQPKHKLVAQTLDGYDYVYGKTKTNKSTLKKLDTDLSFYKNKRFQLTATIPDGKLPDTKRTDNLSAQVTAMSKAQESSYQHIQSSTDANVLIVGQSMTLVTHPNSNYQGDYNVVSTKHSFDFSSQGSHHIYRCDFECKELKRPLNSTIIPKPMPMGITNAVVVSDLGETSDAGGINQDKYGRVEVHFFWDTQASKSTSCYLRVMQQGAGSVAQQQFIPRIKEEVIVDFINGDIDKPIIIGSVFNDKNEAMYGEKDTTKSGIKTGLEEATSHQICFDDKKDKEKLSITSGKDFDLVVTNDSLTSIKANDTINITKSQTTKVEESQTVTITKDYSLKAKNITLEAETKLTLKVGSNQIVIDSSGVEIKANAITLTSTNDTKISAMNFKSSSKAATDISATSNLSLKATAQANLEGTAGVNVKSAAMAKVEGQAGAQVSSTAMTKISGVAMTQISGALVKIN